MTDMGVCVCLEDTHATWHWSVDRLHYIRQNDYHKLRKSFVGGGGGGDGCSTGKSTYVWVCECAFSAFTTFNGNV